MSRLLRDATKANAAGKTAIPTIPENFDEFDDFMDDDTIRKPSQPPANLSNPTKHEKNVTKTSAIGNEKAKTTFKSPAQQPPVEDSEDFENFAGNKSPWKETSAKTSNYQPAKPSGGTFNDIPFDAKRFSKEFFETIEDFGNLRKVVPRELTSFADYDRLFLGCLPEIRLEIRLETEKLNQELQNTFTRIRKLEFMAENSVKAGQNKGITFGLLYDRKDLQNKVALLTQRKLKLLKASELLDSFEMFSDLSRDLFAYQKVANSFVNENKVYFPEESIDPVIKMSLAYGCTLAGTNSFVFEKEDIHDYMIVDLPEGEGLLKEEIQKEYKALASGISL